MYFVTQLINEKKVSLSVFKFLCLKNYPVEMCLEKHKMGFMYNPLQSKPQRPCLSVSFRDSQEMF